MRLKCTFLKFYGFAKGIEETIKLESRTVEDVPVAFVITSLSVNGRTIKIVAMICLKLISIQITLPILEFRDAKLAAIGFHGLIALFESVVE